MDNLNFTLNGDIIIDCDFDAFAGNEDFIKALGFAICNAVLSEDDNSMDDCEDTRADTQIALIYPGGLKNVDTYGEYSHMIDGMEEPCEFSVKDKPFNLVFEREGLIVVDGATYLAAPAFALFHDHTMSPVSADVELLAELEDYLDNNRTVISLGKTDVVVIALEGGICAGV